MVYEEGKKAKDWHLSVERADGDATRSIAELRTALTMGYGFPGDADAFDTERAREIIHADPADLTGIVRLVDEFRGRIIARRSSRRSRRRCAPACTFPPTTGI
ncbi:hypothetical protein AB5J49_13875 [Streptomyces sp. R28]|uniref:Uncharacterized protein n=1 Tax=Streptomyces sp. R28 TaxID=3238628 RepID=A0AB39PY06_9ACTN